MIICFSFLFSFATVLRNEFFFSILILVEIFIQAELPSGSPATVKRFCLLGSGLVDHIRNEILLISSLYHQNIIKLLGYCIHEQKGMIIYEFMENGSLDELIFGWCLQTLSLTARFQTDKLA